MKKRKRESIEKDINTHKERKRKVKEESQKQDLWICGHC